MNDLEHQLTDELQARAATLSISTSAAWQENQRRLGADRLRTRRRPGIVLAVAATVVVVAAATTTMALLPGIRSTPGVPMPATPAISSAAADSSSPGGCTQVAATSGSVSVTVPGADPSGNPATAVLGEGHFCLAFSAGEILLGSADALGVAVPYFAATGAASWAVAVGAVTLDIDRVEFTPTDPVGAQIVDTDFVPLGEVRAFALMYPEAGTLTFYSGSDPVVQTQVAGPQLDPADPRLQVPAVFPTNENGYTFGPGNLAGPRPDLVSVIAVDGTLGYAWSKDLDGAQPASPQEALSQAAPRTVPVYSEDGTTVIGEFGITEPGG